ncbi:unnamed protein product [Brassica napus]|uniref:(rape) hypothetical protein n=1 Tax=Brassica napus TaxID=3708 RepID=A0A816T073_BRANA|nr:unnamed protein product [Brassica napus]
MYRVADHIATVSFAWNSELSVLHDIPIPFDEDRFRMHSDEDFEANFPKILFSRGPVMKLYPGTRQQRTSARSLSPMKTLPQFFWSQLLTLNVSEVTWH